MGAHDDQVIASLEARGLWPPPVSASVTRFRPEPVPALRSAYRGAILGGAVGDALGRPAETKMPVVVERLFGRLTDYQKSSRWHEGPVGTITDDTQLTMEVARCLVAHGGVFDPQDFAAQCKKSRIDIRGIGQATSKAIGRLHRMPWWEAGVESVGNGAAMRAAPVGLAAIGEPDRLRRQAALATVVTHAHPMAVVSAVAHAWVVAALAATPAGSLDVGGLMGGLAAMIDDLADDGMAEREWEHRPGKTGDPVRLADRLAEVPGWLDAPVADALAFFYNGAYVLESLPAALWFFLRCPDDVEGVIVEAVMGGHDADTVASMAGAYVGAYLGDSAFPERWVGEDLEYRDELVALADALYDLGVGAADRVVSNVADQEAEAQAATRMNGGRSVSLEDRVLGGLLGVHSGDSLGATHEFQPWASIVHGRPQGWRLRDIVGGGAFDWPAGAATDDTDLTLAVLDAYLDADGFHLERAAENMLTWLRQGPPDVGGATRSGLRRFEASHDARHAGAGQGFAGNGSLMRCLPTALARRERAVRMLESAVVSAITHDDHRCQLACGAYNEVVAALLDGASANDAVAAGREAAAAGVDAAAAQAVVAAFDEGRELNLAALADSGGNPYGKSGFVLHSLSLAVAAVLDARPLEMVLVDVVHLGGDTDTNGAIAGGLLGVRDGAGAIPERWVNALQHGDRMRAAAPLLVAMRGRI